MRIFANFLKVLFYITMFLTALINTYVGIIMLDYKAVAISMMFFCIIGYGLALAMSIMKKWGLATVISFISSIAITLISYYYVKLGLLITLYLRNHVSSLIVPLLSLMIFIIYRFIRKGETK